MLADDRRFCLEGNQIGGLAKEVMLELVIGPAEGNGVVPADVKAVARQDSGRRGSDNRIDVRRHVVPLDLAVLAQHRATTALQWRIADDNLQSHWLLLKPPRWART